MKSTKLQVFKFGGVAVGTPEAVRVALGHVQAAAPRVAVVVSAMSGVTDLLLDGVAAAARGDKKRPGAAAVEFADRHITLVHALLARRPRVAALEKKLHAAAED